MENHFLLVLSSAIFKNKHKIMEYLAVPTPQKPPRDVCIVGKLWRIKTWDLKNSAKLLDFLYCKIHTGNNPNVVGAQDTLLKQNLNVCAFYAPEPLITFVFVHMIITVVPNQ